MRGLMRKLFGTDGIRGIAGEYPLNERTTFAIGQALGRHLLKVHPHARVVIGQDTRQSSEWIANSVARGLLSRGVGIESAGVITTPGVAYLARTGDFAAGVVISASHNPWQDNGIKVFGHDGYKLPDAVELEIEREIFAHLEETGAAEHVPDVRTLPGNPSLSESYIEWLVYSVTEDLTSLNALIDCANGAATPIAHEVFRRCGVDATFIHDVPDGRNINANCGALHPAVVAKAVQQGNSESHLKRYALGITFDGDADRALFCDDEGKIVNGDAVLLVAARMMKQHGVLANDTVVATTMSNMGLEIALRHSGIRMLRAPVGDKYVLEEMQKTGAVLGGEQSGHIIFRDTDATTGDGILTALRVMAKMIRSEHTLADLVADLKVFPQTIRNIRVREKMPFDKVPEIAEAIRAAEAELNGDGRIVVRYSGTEALARVMVEADSEEKMLRLTDRVADAIQRNLGH
jgi:phosphoglucosamine mutase